MFYFFTANGTSSSTEIDKLNSAIETEATVVAEVSFLSEIEQEKDSPSSPMESALHAEGSSSSVSGQNMESSTRKHQLHAMRQKKRRQQFEVEAMVELFRKQQQESWEKFMEWEEKKNEDGS